MISVFFECIHSIYLLPWIANILCLESFLKVSYSKCRKYLGLNAEVLVWLGKTELLFEEQAYSVCLSTLRCM